MMLIRKYCLFCKAVLNHFRAITTSGKREMDLPDIRSLFVTGKTSFFEHSLSGNVRQAFGDNIVNLKSRSVAMCACTRQ